MHSDNFIQATSVGAGRTTIDVLAGTTEGAASGVAASSEHGAIKLDNSATIQNLSEQPGSLAVAAFGAGNATLTNNTGGVVTGTVAMTGTRSNNFANAGTWNTLGTSAFGDASVNHTGTMNIFGPTTFSGLNALTNSGTLDLAAGGTVATLTVPGNLAFQSGALYIVALNGTTASQTKIGGTATVAGTVEAVFLPGLYSKNETYTILQARGGVQGAFSGFYSPGFSGALSDPLGSACRSLSRRRILALAAD